MTDKTTSPGLYEDLLRFLERPESYPHNPDRVKHIQTHISHAFIAPPYVYKIKKPVDFGFLDYSTLEKRKYFCRREVELNSRLCSDIYLGVVPISREEDTFSMEGDAPGEFVEYAVKMKKLPEEYFLYSYIENDTLTEEHLDRVAEKLAAFYLLQDPGEEILEWGQIEKIRINTDENFNQTEPFIGQTIDDLANATIKRFTNRYFEKQKPLFRRRINEKRIVDGHGDLHLEHIHVTPERVCIYDCIEFNERFRYGDLASDLAYLAMDLDFRGRWKEERYFVDQMARKLEDPDLPRIIDFYKCYRAYVKGKVKSLQSDEEEVPEEDRRRSAKKASGYFDLSLRYALLGSRPVVLIFMGRVGTGKSTLAEKLDGKLNLPRFSSDRIRKTLAGLPLNERTPESRREELYSEAMSVRTYQKLRENAQGKIEQGESAILDATYSSRAEREKLLRLMESAATDVDYIFIEANASDETIKKRLKDREGEDNVVSDARLEDFGMLDDRYKAPEEIHSNHIIRIDTDQPLKDSMEELYSKLVDRHVDRAVE